MIPTINLQDPCFYNEVSYVLDCRVSTKLAFEHIVFSIVSKLPGPFKNSNNDVQELLFFADSGFNENTIAKHSVFYFEVYGGMARKVLSAVERFRFELRLLDDENFEILYEEVARYLEFLAEVESKLKEIKTTYEEDLLYLSN